GRERAGGPGRGETAGQLPVVHRRPGRGERLPDRDLYLAAALEALRRREGGPHDQEDGSLRADGRAADQREPGLHSAAQGRDRAGSGGGGADQALKSASWIIPPTRRSPGRRPAGKSSSTGGFAG